MMWFGLLSYALAAVVYGGAAAVLVAGRPSGACWSAHPVGPAARCPRVHFASAGTA